MLNVFFEIPFLTRSVFQNQMWICQTFRQNYRYYYLLSAIAIFILYLCNTFRYLKSGIEQPVKLNFRTTILPSPFTTSGKWFLTWCEAILKDQSVAKSEKKSIYTFQVYWQVHILKNQLQWKMRNVFCSFHNLVFKSKAELRAITLNVRRTQHQNN